MNATRPAVFSAMRNSLILAFSLLSAHMLYSASIYSQPYTFTTLAGTAGYSNFSGDGTGANAHFNYPSGVAVDSGGNVYVADTFSHVIRKITPAGVVSTLAGLARYGGSVDGTGTSARFNMPRGVAVDNADNVYVGDCYNHTIRKITPSGVVSTFAGLPGAAGTNDGAGGNARFNYPWGVAVDNAGDVYVADRENNTIRKITPAGEVSTMAGQAGTYGRADGTGADARFFSPIGVAVDSARNVYVADYMNFTIRKITAAGVVSTLAGLAEFYGSADGIGADARFHQPTGVAVDSAGNVYVADYANHTLRKVTSAGVVSTLAGLPGLHGSADGTGADAQFYYPSGVAVDSASNIYVSDFNNNTIRSGRAAPASPSLSLRLSSDQVILSWPLEASNFLVEGSSRLSPAPVWLPLTNAVGTNGNRWVLTNDLDMGARFFRLRLP